MINKKTYYRITREEAIVLLKEIEDEYGEPVEMAIEALQERKTGEWKEESWYSECSVCGSKELTSTAYCPNCGAKMKVGE